MRDENFAAINKVVQKTSKQNMGRKLGNCNVIITEKPQFILSDREKVS